MTELTATDIFPGMDPTTGMLPSSLGCTRCGVQLGANRAELYAGTYNGLCYPCTSEPAYLVAVNPLDGLRRWSWPPSSPSHRRHREIRYGYADCSDCAGKGALRRGGAWSLSYLQCEQCASRRDSHPLRRWYSDRMRTLYRVADERYAERLREAAGVKRRTARKTADAMVRALPAATKLTIRAEVRGQYDRIKARFRAHADPLVDRWVPAGETVDYHQGR